MIHRSNSEKTKERTGRDFKQEKLFTGRRNEKDGNPSIVQKPGQKYVLFAI